MKYVLIYWMSFLLSGAPATGTAVFDTEARCVAVGKRLVQASETNGRVTKFMCVPQGERDDSAN